MTVALSVPKTLRTCQDAELHAKFEDAIRIGTLQITCKPSYKITLYQDAELSGPKYYVKAFCQAVLYILSGMVSLGIAPISYACYQNNKEKIRAQKIHTLIETARASADMPISERRRWRMEDEKIQGMSTATVSNADLAKKSLPLQKNIQPVNYVLSSITQPLASNIPAINQLSSFGDAHGNVRLVLETLLKTGYVEIKDATKFTELIILIGDTRKYNSAMPTLFAAALQRGINADKELLPLGDIFADRTGNDFHMLALFCFLNDIGINYTIPHSNHTNELIAYYLLNKDKAINEEYQMLDSSVPQIDILQKPSLNKINNLLNAEDLTARSTYRNQFKHMFEVYITHEQFAIYREVETAETVDEAEKAAVLFCHAPIGKKLFDDLYNIVTSESSADFREVSKLLMPGDKTLQEARRIQAAFASCDETRATSLYCHLEKSAVSEPESFSHRLERINTWMQKNVFNSYENFCHFMMSDQDLACINGDQIENPFYAISWNRGDFSKNKKKDRAHPKYQTDHELPDPSINLFVHGHTAQISALGFSSLDGDFGKSISDDKGNRKIFIW